MSLPLSSNNPSLFHKPQPLSLFHYPYIFSSPPFLTISKLPLSHSPCRTTTHICFTFSPSNSSSNYEREEARWLREEQRWLREEQRWLRQDSYWNTERESLLHQIAALNLRIEQLERLNSSLQGQGTSVSDIVANIASLLQALKEGELGKEVNRIAESGSSAVPLVVEATEEKEEVVVKEVLEFPHKEIKDVKRRTTLRKGSEGEEVRVMQEALKKLGFYSGEEDIEFSSFSSRTERAVKTWQATLGAPEDGIMTAELLERLYMEQIGAALTVNKDPKATDSKLPLECANGAAVASITEVSEVQQTVVKEGDTTEVEVSQQRVFLLGENRWEEPSRLAGRNKQVSEAKTKNTATKCLSCHGEGRLLCMECDGTGEPNIEPQFLEWVEEGAKCPYCEGLGYITCDVCGGKK